MTVTWLLILLLASTPLWFSCLRVPLKCPKCTKAMPRLYAPWRKTRRQWVYGGHSCEECRIEVDLQGNIISPDAPVISNRSICLTMIFALLCPILVVVAGYFIFFWGMDLIQQQAMR